MSIALQKTVTLILLIGLGLILRSKFKNKEQVNGIKELILSVALPSTIFIALMKIHVDMSLLIVPFLALAFNFFMYFVIPFAYPLFGIEKDSSTGRTLLLLLPSLAPGLSSFPFIAEFLGEDSLALSAMADVGNKFFVLIFLYIVAMNLFLRNSVNETANASEKIKSLLISLIQEPINILLVLALILLSFGVSYQTFPAVLVSFFDKTSALMTPLVLIFIGLAVQLREGKKRMVMNLLILRAGLSLLFSAALIALLRIQEPNLVLLAVVLPLSSASFWPFAHISVFNLREDAAGMSKERRTFNMELAVLTLAFSLPFSSGLILGILTTGRLFTDISVIVSAGLLMIGLSVASSIVRMAYLRFSKA
jgi:predicted permease